MEDQEERKLAPNDPMIGFYDRMIVLGHLELVRNIAPVVMAEIGEKFDAKKYKEHCISLGYGSKEAMDALYPEDTCPSGLPDGECCHDPDDDCMYER